MDANAFISKIPTEGRYPYSCDAWKVFETLSSVLENIEADTDPSLGSELRENLSRVFAPPRLRGEMQWYIHFQTDCCSAARQLDARAESEISRGMYVTMWRKTNGRWKVVLDLDSLPRQQPRAAPHEQL